MAVENQLSLEEYCDMSINLDPRKDLFNMARVMVPPTFDEQFDELLPTPTTIEELLGDLRRNLFLSFCIGFAQATNGLFSTAV